MTFTTLTITQMFILDGRGVQLNSRGRISLSIKRRDEPAYELNVFLYLGHQVAELDFYTRLVSASLSFSIVFG